MIRILANDDHFHLVKGTEVEGIENKGAWRIAGAHLVFLAHLLSELYEVGLVKLGLQLLFPCGFNLYVHSVLFLGLWVADAGVVDGLQLFNEDGL